MKLSKQTKTILVILAVPVFIINFSIFMLFCMALNNNNLDKKINVGYYYINNSKGKDYFEKICNEYNIKVVEPTKMADSYNYENGNENTGIQVNSSIDKDEIYYIKIYTLQELDIEDFLKATEIGLKSDLEAKQWITENIQKDSFRTINGLKYKITQSLNRPILEIYTSNGKDYYNAQERKAWEMIDK